MRLYNTLSRETEEFTVVDGVVKIYVCGITPYAPSHVGHALRGVVFDVLRRYLQYRGHEVRHVENFTDIDDKMINGAEVEGISTSQLAERNIEDYFHVMDGLNVLRAHAYPRATEEIPRICEIIETLREKECAYAVAGDVYFSVRSDPDYGKLSRRSLEEMRAGARVEVDEKKTDEMDFALWKAQKPGEPAWDSPWGPGRPGWHIECSAMAMSHLGTPVDIHGGGQDLVFPHHENEIAQTESYDEQRALARFWVHNGLLRIGDETMSKSLGNFVTVTEALNSYSADALRLFFLSSHYRSPLTYSDEAILAQERAAERLRNAALGDGVDGSDRGRKRAHRCGAVPRPLRRGHGRRPQHTQGPGDPLRPCQGDKPDRRGWRPGLGGPLPSTRAVRGAGPDPRRACCIRVGRHLRVRRAAGRAAG